MKIDRLKSLRLRNIIALIVYLFLIPVFNYIILYFFVGLEISSIYTKWNDNLDVGIAMIIIWGGFVVCYYLFLFFYYLITKPDYAEKKIISILGFIFFLVYSYFMLFGDKRDITISLLLGLYYSFFYILFFASRYLIKRIVLYRLNKQILF